MVLSCKSVRDTGQDKSVKVGMLAPAQPRILHAKKVGGLGPKPDRRSAVQVKYRARSSTYERS